MKLTFTKMHGLGNDFVVINGIDQKVVPSIENIRYWADRHRGIGCDQVLLIEPSDRIDADVRYRMFNADGSEVEQCGNGARCVALFLYKRGFLQRAYCTLSAKAGLMRAVIHADDTVTVEMGQPSIGVEKTFTFEDHVGALLPLSIGNPHAVIAVDSVDHAPVDLLGAHFAKNHPWFPEGVNVGFSQKISSQEIVLRVYERGVGETQACGSGACAAVVAGIHQKQLKGPVIVRMRGGNLTIDWKENQILMTGPATFVFTGQMESA